MASANMAMNTRARICQGRWLFNWKKLHTFREKMRDSPFDVEGWSYSSDLSEFFANMPVTLTSDQHGFFFCVVEWLPRYQQYYQHIIMKRNVNKLPKIICHWNDIRSSIFMKPQWVHALNLGQSRDTQKKTTSNKLSTSANKRHEKCIWCAVFVFYCGKLKSVTLFSLLCSFHPMPNE